MFSGCLSQVHIDLGGLPGPGRFKATLEKRALSQRDSPIVTRHELPGDKRMRRAVP
jgi:hypothetical protein